MKKYFLFLIILITFIGCTERIILLKPFVDTLKPENVLTNSAILGGRIVGEGGTDITEYGLVWSTSNSPTVNENKIMEGDGLGYFNNIYTVFEPATTYYYAAYAINKEGVGYGDVWKFTTTEAAPCKPETNFMDAETTLSFLNDGNYSSVSVIDDPYYSHGSDYLIRGAKGPYYARTELDIHFDGDFDELQSGAYLTVSDLDSAFNIPNKAVVTLKHDSLNFILANDNIVYIERIDNNTIIVRLCDVDFSTNLTSTTVVNVNISTNITVSN